MQMKYKATILRLKQHRDKLRSQEEYELAEVIDDAVSIVDLHSPERVVVIRTPMGSALVCPNCGGQICHTDMVCPRCTKLIDWEDADDE